MTDHQQLDVLLAHVENLLVPPVDTSGAGMVPRSHLVWVQGGLVCALLVSNFARQGLLLPNGGSSGLQEAPRKYLQEHRAQTDPFVASVQRQDHRPVKLHRAHCAHQVTKLHPCYRALHIPVGWVMIAEKYNHLPRILVAS